MADAEPTIAGTPPPSPRPTPDFDPVETENAYVDDSIPVSSEVLQLQFQENEKIRQYRALAHRDVATRRIAIILLVMMGVTIAAHYIAVATLVLNGHTAEAKDLNDIFNHWLPVISGLVGAAVAFYFGKGQ